MNVWEDNANGEGAVPSGFQPSDVAAPQQGTDFVYLNDPRKMRMVLIVEAIARRGWEATFGLAQSESAGEDDGLDPARSHPVRSRLIRSEAGESSSGERDKAADVWEEKPLSISVKESNHLYACSRKMGFRPEVAEQILGEGVRRSLRLSRLVDHVYDETGRTILWIGALEALWVQNERGGCRFLLAVHAVAGTPQIGAVANVSERAAAAGTLESGVAGTPGNAGTPAGCSPDYPSLFRTLRWREKFPEFASTLTRILETHGGCPAGSVVFPGASVECPSDVPSIFTITWVPRAETAAWILASDVGNEDAAARPAASPAVPAAASELLGDPAGAAVALGFPADRPAGIARQGGCDASAGRSASDGRHVGDRGGARDPRVDRGASAAGGDHGVRAGFDASVTGTVGNAGGAGVPGTAGHVSDAGAVGNVGDAEALFLEDLEELQHGLCVPVAEEVLEEIRQEGEEACASRGETSAASGRSLPGGTAPGRTASGETAPEGMSQRAAICGGAVLRAPSGKGTSRKAASGAMPSDVSLGRAAVAASGWKWGYLPSPEGFELGEEIWDEAKRALHRFSRSWAVSVYRHGAAYLQRREDDFSLYALQRMCTRHVDVYLLTLFNRIRVRTFSEKLAALAAELEETTNGLFADRGNAAEGSAYRVASVGVAPGSGGEIPRNSAETEEALERLIAKALALDSDAVAFLAAEWWTNVDVGYGTQTDKVLEWAQKAGRLDSAVDRVVEQSRMLRDSVQTLLDRQERQIEKQNQEIEREQQRSARVMEWAVGCLAFIGMPMTAVLELWINWDLDNYPAKRAFWPWWPIFIAGMLGSIVFGLLAVRRLGRRSRRSDRRSRRGARRSERRSRRGSRRSDSRS